MVNTYQAPLRQRNPAAFVAVAATSAIAFVLVVAVAALAAAFGMLLLLAHALSDPLVHDRHDEGSVRFRASLFSRDSAPGKDMSDSMCRRILGSFDARDRWYPPGRWLVGAVTIAGDDATVAVTHPVTAGADRETTTTVRFRYEGGLWQYCGVS
ncbi:hypothetical protein [Tsukamurella pseudospumae]|uniref:DUF4878 domain-containing protein n=1 Tax=Tsukamurella pseudospumae TaxID=239498 RepID=A0A137YT35_9ACTN|nr:hypothetical protein [Tsukamurella pseudospumae]KXO89031.1 hypothetical protein AXK61_10385 [Tsukamurella pseudospumae]